jgi:hypothetical protein
MRTLFSLILVFTSISLFGQNGYVTLDNDSTLIGYLKYYVSTKDGHEGIELWRAKNDKEPLRIPMRSITGYAIKKDTFKTLKQFKPFQDNQSYFELVDARLKHGGKVNLYVIENNANRVSTYTGGGLIPAIIDESLGNYSFLYILEDKKTGYLKAISSKKEKLIKSLMDFFPEKYILKYSEVKGEINYRSIPDLVKLYNSK